MTHQQIARRNIQNAINYIVGGYYNSFLDGYEEDLPKSYKDLKDEIYASAISDTFAYGGEVVIYNHPVKEMRFAGEDYCRRTIHSILSNDECVKEIADSLKWVVTDTEDTQANEDMCIWSGYVLRKTYTEGNSKGNSYIYIRGGYVKDDSKDTFIFKDEVYESQRSAKIVASRYKSNELRSPIRDRTISNQEATCTWEVVKVVNGHLA